MSMLSGQIDELRLMGDGQAAKGEFTVATLLREAADTIESLRERLQGGTCEMETDWDYLTDGIPDAPEDTWAYMCSSCDWSFRYDRGIKPSYCPNCGKAVTR